MNEETKKCPNCGWSKTYENDTSHHYNELKQELQARKDEELDYMTIYIKGFEDGKQAYKDKEDKLREYIKNNYTNQNERVRTQEMGIMHQGLPFAAQCKNNVCDDILNLLDGSEK